MPSRDKALRDKQRTHSPIPWLRPPGASHLPPLGVGHTQARATHTQPWRRPPSGQAPENHSPSECGMNCTHGAHTMVCRTTLRVIICTMSCALDAHMFVLRRTSKHNQPPHMGLSSVAPYQAAWLFLLHHAVLRFTRKPNHGPNGGVPRKQPHRPLPLAHTNEQATPFPSFSRNAITTCAFYGSNGTNGN